MQNSRKILQVIQTLYTMPSDPDGNLARRGVTNVLGVRAEHMMATVNVSVAISKATDRDLITNYLMGLMPIIWDKTDTPRSDITPTWAYARYCAEDMIKALACEDLISQKDFDVLASAWLYLIDEDLVIAIPREAQPAHECSLEASFRARRDALLESGKPASEPQSEVALHKARRLAARERVEREARVQRLLGMR